MIPSTVAAPAGSLSHSVRVGLRIVWIDIKQGLRKHLSGTGWRDRLLRGGGITFGLIFIAGLHVAAFSLFIYAWDTPSDVKGNLIGGLSTSIWCFLLFVMISGGLVRAIVVLHEQDDSSLLFSAPVSPRAVLAARLFGNALQSCLVDGFIIVPYINIRIFTLVNYQKVPGFIGDLHYNFLCGYVLWFALAIIVTCIDGLFSFGLIAWLGMRRARLFSQAVPFILIFGVTVFAGSLSVSVAQMNITTDQAHMPPELVDKFVAISHTPMIVLAWAGAGQWPYLLSIVGAALLLALVTLLLTERAFVEGTQHLAEDTGTAKPGTADGRFRSGVLRLEIRKNLRLIVRTPMMMVQCLAQSLMPIGIACVLGRDDVGRAVAFFVIFAAGVLSGMFTIAAGTVEECDDLLSMSPRGGRLFRFGKILSGCVWPLGIAFVVAIGLLIAGEPLLAAAVFFGGIPLGLSSSLAAETFAKPVRPGQRPKLLADPLMMIPLLGMQISSGIVAGVTVFAAAFSGLFLFAGLCASYVIFVLAIGLAQLRKPLF